MKVLITGGLGYLGTVIAKHLETDHEIEIVDLKNGRDFRDIKEIKADAVVHLAAIVGDRQCAIKPGLSRETNFRSIDRLTRLCKRSSVRRFIFASTCSIYGADSVANCFESSRINPISLYATTKYAAERTLLKSESETFHPTILRFGTAFGQSPSMRYNLVVNMFAKGIADEGRIVIHGGDQFRPFIHTTDIARAIASVLKAPIYKVSGEIFNIANENITLNGLGELIRNEYPWVDVRHSHECRDKRTYRVNTFKAWKVLGFMPEISIKQGLKEMVENV